MASFADVVTASVAAVISGAGYAFHLSLSCDPEFSEGIALFAKGAYLVILALLAIVSFKLALIAILILIHKIPTYTRVTKLSLISLAALTEISLTLSADILI